MQKISKAVSISFSKCGPFYSMLAVVVDFIGLVILGFAFFTAKMGFYYHPLEFSFVITALFVWYASRTIIWVIQFHKGRPEKRKNVS